MRKPIILSLLVVILVVFDAFAYDHEITHRLLTEQASDTPEFNDFLKKQLKLDGEINEVVNGDSILEWLKNGSFEEDEPNCRASNHFHNPLDPWTDSYLSDQPWFINWWCSPGEYPPENIKSNITWATGFISPDQKIMTDNQWDWDDAREYYHIYLTGMDFEYNIVAVTKDERDIYLSKCLRALGQAMHLLQDMSVPAHVRNDFKSHLDWKGITLSTIFRPKKWLYERYEYYVEKNIDTWLNTMDPIPSVNLTNRKLTDLWDAEEYDAANPDPEVSINAP